MQEIPLPPPRFTGTMSVEAALATRRSVREYAQAPLSLAEVSQLLFAAQGVTDREGLRTAPSAGALYPLEVYLVLGLVEGIRPGVYRYTPGKHSLVLVAGGDRREALYRQALFQDPILHAPVSFVVTGEYPRTEVKYGPRGRRYVDMEVGHAVENLLLQGVALGLGCVVIGAYDDAGVQGALAIPARHVPLAVIPCGKPR